ncbi:MAG: ATP-binding protein [Synergistaceae bacterium]|jgi:hypothetical protein|nr:ATP-binding protein [Synergistaceae bacterium]
MSPADIQEQFFQDNPFSSGIAREPWDNDDPDVLSLHQSAYEHVCRLIQAKNQNPQAALAGLILGESGSGKTHFLKRLLDYTQRNDIPAIFVSVKPLLNPKKPMRHLLREIAVNLERVQIPKEKMEYPPAEKRKGMLQFEYFVTKMLQRYREDKPGPDLQGGISHLKSLYRKMLQRYRKDKPEFDLQEAIAHFKTLYPGINENLLRAIFTYGDSSRQRLILTWLEGRDDEDHVSILKFPDREAMDDADLEEDAHDIILSLGMLLEYCGMTMVICFDQLDSMREQNLIVAFGDILHLLVNESSMLPLAFIRQNTWVQRFSLLDTAVIQRLSNNIDLLEGCTILQAQELLKARIESRPGFRDSVEEKFQWLMDRMGAKLKEGYMPRRVIELANDAVLHSYETGPSETGHGAISETNVPVPREPDIVAFFAKEYSRERDKVVGDFSVWPPDAERLLKTLRVYLESRAEYDALQPGEDRFVALTGKYRNTDHQVDCAFIINTADHHKTAQAAFNRGVKFLQDHPDRKCYYISDKRCQFKESWKKAHEAKEAFEAHHGTVLFLGQSQAIDWYGLTSLIFKLEAGDVSLPASAGFRTATAEDFALYMEKGFDKDLLKLPDEPPPPPVDEELLEKKTFEILTRSPMGFMAVALLQSELKKGGVNVTRDRLLEFITQRPDNFVLHESTDDNLVLLSS